MNIISSINEKKYSNGKSVNIEFIDKDTNIKVGHLSYDVYNKGEFAVLYHGFVKEKYRGNKILKNNFDLMITDLKKENIKEIRLNANNDTSKKIWESFGFEETIKGTRLMVKKLF